MPVWTTGNIQRTTLANNEAGNINIQKNNTSSQPASQPASILRPEWKTYRNRWEKLLDGNLHLFYLQNPTSSHPLAPFAVRFVLDSVAIWRISGIDKERCMQMLSTLPLPICSQTKTVHWTIFIILFVLKARKIHRSVHIMWTFSMAVEMGDMLTYTCVCISVCMCVRWKETIKRINRPCEWRRKRQRRWRCWDAL